MAAPTPHTPTPSAKVAALQNLLHDERDPHRVHRSLQNLLHNERDPHRVQRSLQNLLHKERDPHRVQRELVRASLLYCPDKNLPRAA